MKWGTGLGDSKQKVFARDATGLVKQLSSFDLFNLSYGQIIPAGGIVFLPPLAAFAFPQSNLFYGYLLGLPLIGAIALVYAYLASAMPRSGGDYIFNSRILHPAIGFMTSFLLTFELVWFMGISASIWSASFASGFLATIGRMAGSASLVANSAWFATSVGETITGTVLLVVIGLLILFGRSVWSYMKILAVFVIVFSAVNIIFLAVTPNSTFIHAFNLQYPGQYQAMMTQAQSKGWLPGFTISGTFLALIYVMSSYNGFNFAVYAGGEAKHASRSMPLAVLGSIIIAGITFAAWMWAIYHVFGYNFYSASSYLFSGGYPVPVTPTVNFLFAIIPQSPLIELMGALAFIIGYSYAMPTTIIPAIMNTFAYSFDRVLPDKLSFVSDRTHTPIYIVIILFVLAEAGMLSTVFAGAGVVIGNGALLLAIVFLVTSISAILFPFRTKNLFEQAPAFVKAKVVGFPVISLLGILAALVSGFLLYAAIINPYVGGSAASYPFTAGVIIGGFAIYYGAKWYRRRGGIDLSMAFKSLPPE